MALLPEVLGSGVCAGAQRPGLSKLSAFCVLVIVALNQASPLQCIDGVVYLGSSQYCFLLAAKNGVALCLLE